MQSSPLSLSRIFTSSYMENSVPVIFNYSPTCFPSQLPLFYSLLLYEFIYSRQSEFVTGLFHSAGCLYNLRSSMLHQWDAATVILGERRSHPWQHASEFPSFIRLSHIPLHGHPTLRCASDVHLMKDTHCLHQCCCKHERTNVCGVLAFNSFAGTQPGNVHMGSLCLIL